MDVAGSAVGIASLGIQVCQSLLTYYDGWKAYESDISHTYESIADLSRTLTLLKASLEREGLDKERAESVDKCLQSCKTGLGKLSEKAQKLQKYGQPQNLQQRAWSELQRLWYPFRANTLAKLRVVVSDIQDRLHLAVQVLQLDTDQRAQELLFLLDKRTTKMEADLQAMQQSDQFKKLIGWLSPPDPWTNHSSARQKCEPQTGDWLLQSNRYHSWKAGLIRHVWLHGKPGCGKTVLCSTAIEDVQAYSKGRENSAVAIFYFSFSDNQKQTYEDLLRSLIAQLGWREPGLSLLQQAYDKSNRSVPARDDLESILLALARSYNEVFLILDALDESPESDEVRQNLLERVEKFAQSAPNLKILATSRELLDIRESMETMNAGAIQIATTAVDADIRKYVSTQLSRDRKLCRLSPTTKVSVEETISQRADGMFRWAYCQLQELKKLKSFRPSFVKKALHDLPANLDETYTRMLAGIAEMYREDALILLRWLAYARSPPTLGELVETVTINLAENSVDTDDRGNLEDTLELLSGLVTVVRMGRGDDDEGSEDLEPASDDDDRESEDSGSASEDDNGAHRHQQMGMATKVRLAHFSVKEYLESKRILDSDASDFYLESTKAHHVLAQSCLLYILSYSKDPEKTAVQQDLTVYPLLRYSAQSWFYHSSLQQVGDVHREIDLLSSNALKEWLHIYRPDSPRITGLGMMIYPGHDPDPDPDPGSGLYYASILGLNAVVKKLLDIGSNPNAEGGYFRYPLQAASYAGYEEVVYTLLNKGANVNAQGGDFGCALQAASFEGHQQIAQMLIDADADVNARGRSHGNALQEASFQGHQQIAQMLIDAGADVNAQGGNYSNALQAASFGGHQQIAQMLIDAGADVNAQGGHYGNALQEASFEGHQQIVKMLIDADADINAQGGVYGNALQGASFGGHQQIAKMLIDAGADINAQGGHYGNALQAASFGGHQQIAQMLIDADADINAQGGVYGNALQAASLRSHQQIAQMLIGADADINAQGGEYGNALQAASLRSHQQIAQMLIDAGADVNAQGGVYGNALQAASFEGHQQIAKMLIDAGADVNAQGGEYGNALQAASFQGHQQIAQMLIDAGADVNAQGGRYGNALQVASFEGYQRIVKMLIDAGTDVNAQGGSYGNALQAASHSGRKLVVQTLIDLGADINAQGGVWGSALQAASSGSYKKIVKMLIDSGVDVNAQGERYSSALQAATSKGHQKVVQRLLDAGAGAGEVSVGSEQAA